MRLGDDATIAPPLGRCCQAFATKSSMHFVLRLRRDKPCLRSVWDTPIMNERSCVPKPQCFPSELGRASQR